MPVLPMESNVYPANLFEHAQTEANEGRSWWVLHTKPRQEKAVLRYLLDSRSYCYLPLLKRRIGRGLNYSYVPLFTSYVFLFGNGQERLNSLTTNRIVRTLEVPDQNRFRADLEQIHRLLASGLPVAPEDRLYPGTLVEICHGPLAGIKGIIVRDAGRERFIVQVDFIQKGVSITFDRFQLKAAVD